jgi:hypothetical protein
VSDRPALAGWLLRTFVQHFSELERFGPTGPPEVVEAPVRVDLDLGSGMTASAGDVAVEMTGVLDRRLFQEEGLSLGGASYGLRNVYLPCRHAEVRVRGVPVAGDPQVAPGPPPASSAFLAVAEVWTGAGARAGARSGPDPGAR